MFVDKLKKIKTRVVLRGQVPCTKEVWRYIGVNNVYRCLHAMINSKCVVIICPDGAQAKLTEKDQEIVVENPLIRWIRETARANELPVYLEHPQKKAEWQNAMVISSHLYHMKKGRGFLFYRSPLDVWKKIDHPVLAGKAGRYYDAAVSSELCSGYSRHSMAYAWAHLVLGPLGLELERRSLNILSEGKTLVLLGEKEHIFAEYMKCRGHDLPVFPWAEHMEKSNTEARDHYLKRLKKKTVDTVLICTGAYPDEKSGMEKLVTGLQICDLPVYLAAGMTPDGPDSCHLKQWNAVNCGPYRMDHIEKDEIIYSYNEGWDAQKRQLLLRGMLDFAAAWERIEEQKGERMIFSQRDLQEIMSFGDRYLVRMEQEGEEV